MGENETLGRIIYDIDTPTSLFQEGAVVLSFLGRDRRGQRRIS